MVELAFVALEDARGLGPTADSATERHREPVGQR